MPPKNRKSIAGGEAAAAAAAEAAALAVPEVKCSLLNVQYITDIVRLTKSGDLKAAMKLIGDSEEVALPDYEICLKSSIAVDMWFGHISFAMERDWKPATCTIFIGDMLTLFDILRSEDLCELKIKLRQIINYHSKDLKSEASPAFTQDDLAAIAKYITSGMIQHFSLYIKSLSSPRQLPTTEYMSVVINQAAIPMPLSAAVGDSDANLMDKKTKEFNVHLTEIREAEDALRQEALLQLQKEKEASDKQREEEEMEAATAVEAAREDTTELLREMQTEVQQNLMERQQRLLERLEMLERPPES